MIAESFHILLAEDDKHDRFLFREALNELQIEAEFTVVCNGEQLMNYLNDPLHRLPDILFLDLNMPRKNGFECLAEIKKEKRLKSMQVVFFSTSYPWNITYTQDVPLSSPSAGLLHYIRKPNDFEALKKAIRQIITMNKKNKSLYQSRG